YTTSTDFRTADALQAEYGGGLSDYFVAKLTADGSELVFSSYLGGSGQEGAVGRASIGVDGAGSIYLFGRTASIDFPLYKPLYSEYRGGTSDAFVAKIRET